MDEVTISITSIEELVEVTITITSIGELYEVFITTTSIEELDDRPGPAPSLEGRRTLAQPCHIN